MAFPTTSPATPSPTSYDVDGAKKLLAEAGFPNGFSGVKLHYPNIFGAGYNTIAELMVQMLTKNQVAAVETEFRVTM